MSKEAFGTKNQEDKSS